MSHTIGEKGRQKESERCIKELSMEGFPPTMLDVVFLKELQIIRKASDRQGFFELARLKESPDALVCPHCHSGSIYRHGRFARMVCLQGRAGVIKRLKLTMLRYRCRCCARTFCSDARVVGLAKWARRNKPLNDSIISASADGMSNKRIAARFHISQSTVERQLHRSHKAMLKEQLAYPLPRQLGIDEHSIHRGGKYAVTLVDLEHHRVYDVIEGKNAALLAARLRKMKGRLQVRMVCIDLSASFRSVVARVFPNAKVVADRFHVIKLITKSLHDFCKLMLPEQRWQRGFIKALRTRSDRLTAKQHALLEGIFKEHPMVKAAYDFKTRLCELLNLKTLTQRTSKKPLQELREMIDQLTHTAHETWRTLGRTLRTWFTPIIRMWRFSRNNGITEGFHRKMKLIQRRAYGFRNFENYRLRVLIECGHLYIPQIDVFKNVWG